MTTLTINHLAKSYGDKQVLDDLHIEVAEGELVSLLGPSGCGKTTTLNIVAGFISPDSGSVLIGNRDVTAAPPYRRDTAIVFQNYALFPHMRVARNVGYGLRARKLPKYEAAGRVRETLRLMGIEELAARYPSQLSGGQQQRVAVARAVAVRPGVLLMDEPLSNLDAKLRGDIRLELRALQRQLNQTVLFVTHDQEEALTISDRIVVMNGGRIEQLGTPAEVFERPATVFVADFMGVENIFSGHGDRSRWHTDSGLTLPLPADPTCTHVGVRPSRVQVGVDGEPGCTDTQVRFAAQIENRAYLGDTIRYALRVDGLPLIATAARGSLELFGGDRVVTTIAASDLLPLTGSASPAGAADATRAPADAAGTGGAGESAGGVTEAANALARD